MLFVVSITKITIFRSPRSGTLWRHSNVFSRCCNILPHSLHSSWKMIITDPLLIISTTTSFLTLCQNILLIISSTILLNNLPGVFIKNNSPAFLWLWIPAIISRNCYFHGALRLCCSVSSVPLMFTVWVWSSLGYCAPITAKIRCNKPSAIAALTYSQVKLQWRIGFGSEMTGMGLF